MSNNKRQALLSLFLLILTYGTDPQKKALNSLADSKSGPSTTEKES